MKPPPAKPAPTASPKENLKSTWISFAVRQEAAFVQPPTRRGRILITGMGAVPSRRFLQDAFRRARTTPHLLLTCGFAGALNPALSVGTVLFSADAWFPWLDPLQKGGAQPGRFYCSDHVVCHASEKRLLWQRTGADAVEMESAGLRDLCAERNIPSATVRVISDTAAENLPLDFNALVGPDGQVRLGKLLFQVLKSPGRVPALLRLRRQSQTAARKLAAVLHQALSEIPPF